MLSSRGQEGLPLSLCCALSTMHVPCRACRLRDAAARAQQAAAQAACQLAQLQQDIEAAAGAAAQALQSSSDSAKAAAAKAGAAAMALGTAVKWAAAVLESTAAAGTVLPAAEALLQQLLAPAAPDSSRGGCDLHTDKAAALPLQMQQVWRVQAAPGCAPAPASAADSHDGAEPVQEQQGHRMHGADASSFGSQPLEAVGAYAVPGGDAAASAGTSAACGQGGMQLSAHDAASMRPPSPTQAAPGPSPSPQALDSQPSLLSGQGQSSGKRAQAAVAALLGRRERALARAQHAGKHSTSQHQGQCGVACCVPILSWALFLLCRAGGRALGAGRLDGGGQRCHRSSSQVAQEVGNARGVNACLPASCRHLSECMVFRAVQGRQHCPRG